MVLVGEAIKAVPLFPPKPFAFRTAKSNLLSSNSKFSNKKFTFSVNTLSASFGVEWIPGMKLFFQLPRALII